MLAILDILDFCFEVPADFAHQVASRRLKRPRERARLMLLPALPSLGAEATSADATCFLLAVAILLLP